MRLFVVLAIFCQLMPELWAQGSPPTSGAPPAPATEQRGTGTAKKVDIIPQAYEKFAPRYGLTNRGEKLVADNILLDMQGAVRGMAILKKRPFKVTDIPSKLLNEETTRRYIAEGRITLVVGEDRARLQERLTTFGLVSDPSLLSAAMNTLLIEDLGIYYSLPFQELLFFDTRKSGDFSSLVLRGLAVAHADQQEAVRDKLVALEGNFDAKLALEMVLAGDQLYSQFFYDAMRLNVDLGNYDVAGSIDKEIAAQIVDVERKKQIPRALLDLYFLPKVYGVQFFARGLTQFSIAKMQAIYKKLPNSTEKVLHPDKYYRKDEKDEPVRLVLPGALGKVLAKDKWQMTTKDIIGEFFSRLVFERSLPKDLAQSAAAGWDGDTVAVFTNPIGRKAMIWFSAWDTPSDADEAFAAKQKYAYAAYTGRKLTMQTNSDSTLRFSSDNEGVFLKKGGASVLMLRGFSPDLTAEIAKVFE